MEEIIIEQLRPFPDHHTHHTGLKAEAEARTAHGLALPEELLKNSLLLFEDEDEDFFDSENKAAEPAAADPDSVKNASPPAMAGNPGDATTAGQLDAAPQVIKAPEPGKMMLEGADATPETYYQSVKKEISRYVARRQEIVEMVRRRKLAEKKNKPVKLPQGRLKLDKPAGPRDREKLSENKLGLPQPSPRLWHEKKSFPPKKPEPVERSSRRHRMPDRKAGFTRSDLNYDNSISAPAEKKLNRAGGEMAMSRPKKAAGLYQAWTKVFKQRNEAAAGREPSSMAMEPGRDHRLTAAKPGKTARASTDAYTSWQNNDRHSAGDRLAAARKPVEPLDGFKEKPYKERPVIQPAMHAGRKESNSFKLPEKQASRSRQQAMNMDLTGKDKRKSGDDMFKI